MAPRKQPYSRRAVCQKPAPSRRVVRDEKTSNVGGADVIRILSRRGSGIFRDGMTVDQFLRAVPNRKEGLRMLLRCQRAGIVAFQQGSVEAELARAVAINEDDL